MPKIIIKDPLSYDELLEKLKKAGVTLGANLTNFIRDHASHAGLSVESGTTNRAYCRTCNVRDS